ncbi:MAG: hypothetical protein ABI947_30365 [Chloroflexota bacterium]
MIKTSHNPIRDRWLWWCVALLLGLTVWLAIHWPHGSLWYDEALTTWVATDSWQSLLRWCTQVDIQVPFHYVVLRLWTYAAGDSEFTLRLLSAFCVLLAAAGMIAAGQRLAKISGLRPHVLSLVAALLLGSLPGTLWLGYEVRAYALALALYAWATAILCVLIDPNGQRSRRGQTLLIVGYALLMIATLYTHYTAIAGLAAHIAIFGVLVIVRRSRVLLITFSAAMLLIGIGFAPWLPVLLTRSAADRSYYVGSPILPDRSIAVMLGFKLLGREDVPAAALPLVVGYGVLITLGALVALRKRRWPAALVGAMIALWPVAITAVLVYFKPKLAGRYVWPAWIGFDLLVGVCIIGLMRWQRILGAIALIALVAMPWLTGELGHPPDSDFRAAYAYLCSQGDPQDVIALRDGTLFVVNSYYGRRAPCNTERATVSLPIAEMTNVEQSLTYPIAQAAVQPLIARHPPSIWVVAWQGDVMDPQSLTYGVLDNLGKHTVIGKMFGDVRVDRYEDIAPISVEPPAAGQLMNITPVVGGPTLQSVRVIAPEVAHAGDVITVQAWWTRGEKLQPDLRVSARITTLDGGWTYAQVDQPPSSWKYVDDRWQAGVPTLGRYELRVGSDVPVGKVAIRYLLYDAAGHWPQIILKVGEVTILQSGEDHKTQ